MNYLVSYLVSGYNGIAECHDVMVGSIEEANEVAESLASTAMRNSIKIYERD